MSNWDLRKLGRYMAGERYLAEVRAREAVEVREIHDHLPFAHFMDVYPSNLWIHAGVKR